VMEWSTLPIELVVRGRRALVVGAAGECVSKVRRLVDAGAAVTVVTQRGDVDAALASLAESGVIRLEDRDFEDADATSAVVVFLGTEHATLGAALSDKARREHRLVSTLDRPEASTFINPAVARENGISVSISSGGGAPGLVKALRESLGRAIADASFGAFVQELVARRASEPRGKRSHTLRTLLDGFGLEVRCTYPTWFRAPPLIASKG